MRSDVHDDVLNFYTTVAVPTLVASPAILRFRMFQVDRATSMEEESYITEDNETLHTYLTVVEMETEQWPWDVVVELAEIPEWKEYFEKQEAVVSQAEQALRRSVTVH